MEISQSQVKLFKEVIQREFRPHALVCSSPQVMTLEFLFYLQ